MESNAACEQDSTANSQELVTWAVLAQGFVYGPFESRHEAGAWCAKEHKRKAQVLPLNVPAIERHRS